MYIHISMIFKAKGKEIVLIGILPFILCLCNFILTILPNMINIPELIEFLNNMLNLSRLLMTDGCFNEGILIISENNNHSAAESVDSTVYMNS